MLQDSVGLYKISQDPGSDTLCLISANAYYENATTAKKILQNLAESCSIQIEVQFLLLKNGM